MAKEFREEFKKNSKDLADRLSIQKQKLAELKKLEVDLDEDSFDWKKVGEMADKVQSLLHKNDPVALKTSYKQLFKAIYVSEMNDMGERELRFVLNDGEEATIIHSQPSSLGVLAEKCIDSKKMG